MDSILLHELKAPADVEEHRLMTVAVGSRSHAVAIKALTTNTAALWLGLEGLANSEAGFPLNPGEAITLDLKNAGQIFYTLGAEADKIAWLITGV